MDAKSKTAALQASAAAIIWSTNPLFILMADWHPLGNVLVRTLVVMACLVLFHMRGKQICFRIQPVPILCAIAFSSGSMCWIIACSYTKVANVIIIALLFPVITLALDLAFRRLLPKFIELVLLCIGLCGVYIILRDELGKGTMLGNLLACGSACSTALHIFFSNKLKNKEEGLGVLVISQAISLSVIALLMLGRPISMPNSSQVSWLLALGLTSYVSFVLWSRACLVLRGHRIGLLALLEVPVSIGLCWFFADQAVETSTLIGGAIVIGASMMLRFSKETH